ncbi:MAG: extracellular solute-binding protein, partial [Angelakisella sp.]
VLHQSKLAEFIPTGKLVKINEVNASVDWSGYNEAQLNSVKVGGTQYSIPLDTHALVMFYNKDILGRAGVTEADLKAVNSIESWEAILEKTHKVIKDNEHVLDVVSSGANTIQQFWTWYVLNAQAGGQYLDGKTAVLNSDAGVKALDLLKSWNKKGYIKNGIEDGTSYDLFKSGVAAIQFTGVWATGNYETAQNLKFGVMPIPAIVGQQKTWGDSHTIAVPNYISAEKQVAAVKFADWINDHAITWAKAGHVPAKKSVMASAEYKAMPYRSGYADVINQVVYYPANEKLGACTDLAAAKVSQAFSNDIDSKKALDEVKAEIDAVLSR